MLLRYASKYHVLDQIWVFVSTISAIGTASANSVESYIVRLTLHNVTLSHRKHANTIISVIAAKQAVIYK